tara:strand:+ start:480 stop:803 length:324 start_codon:yes stop_codon:yes gene_type:complete
MAEKNQNAGPEMEGLTEEQMAQKREEITGFYKENIPHLKTQLEYEELLRDIEKARAERIQAQIFLTQAMAGPQQSAESNVNPSDNGSVPPVPPAPSAKRTLKKVNNE